MQTPHEARMCPIDFEVQRSRSQCINYWKWFPAHNCFPFTPIIMKIHMQTPHEARMCPIDFEVQRSRSQCINYWKWFPAHNCFPFTPIIMKLHMQTPHESRMCTIDFEVKRSKRFWYLEKLSLCHRCLYEPVAWYWLGWRESPLAQSVEHWSRNKRTRVRIPAGAVQFFTLLYLHLWHPRGVFVPLGQPRSSWN